MIRNILFLLMPLAILFSGCDDTVTNQAVDNTVIPDKGVSYSKHIQPIFYAKCTLSGCHDDGGRSGGLSLMAYNSTVANLTIVTPYSPQTSHLVWSIEGASGGTPMPPIGYPSMNANQINGVKTWIKEGAKNN